MTQTWVKTCRQLELFLETAVESEVDINETNDKRY